MTTPRGIPELGAPAARPVHRDITDEHLARNQRQIRGAFRAVKRACRDRAARDRLQGDVQLGFDHTADPDRPWWCRVYLTTNSGQVKEMLVEQHASAVVAMEAMIVQLDLLMGRRRA